MADNANTTPPAVPEPSDYPGGENNPAYRWALTAFVILFLLLICIGVLNYFGLLFRRMG